MGMKRSGQIPKLVCLNNKRDLQGPYSKSTLTLELILITLVIRFSNLQKVQNEEFELLRKIQSYLAHFCLTR